MPHRISVEGGHYEIEDGQMVTRGFMLSQEALNDGASFNILGAAHRAFRLPEGCTILAVDHEIVDLPCSDQDKKPAKAHKTLVRGARDGHYRFIPDRDKLPANLTR